MTSTTGPRRSAVRAALVLVLTLAAVTAAAPAASEPQVAAGKLGFQVILQSGAFHLPCPGGVQDLGAPPATACVPFTGTGSVRGLGNVSATYTELLEVGPPACPADFTKQLPTTGRLSVAGKGEIFFTFAEGAPCVERWWLSELPEFTITGGTGPFAAASGKGKRVHGWSVPGTPAAEIWTGELEVPGLAFDVGAPTLHGAGPKTVRAQKGAKSARVTFKVTATDDVGGSVPVSCQPRSGSGFKIGKTRVNCSATDTSGNTDKAAFTVTVTRPR